MMFAAGPEKNRYRESDDCSETNPPGNSITSQLMRVEPVPKIFARPRQSAHDCDDDEANDHGNDKPNWLRRLVNIP
jgi:hypothetical protein